MQKSVSVHLVPFGCVPVYFLCCLETEGLWWRYWRGSWTQIRRPILLPHKHNTFSCSSSSNCRYNRAGTMIYWHMRCAYQSAASNIKVFMCIAYYLRFWSPVTKEETLPTVVVSPVVCLLCTYQLLILSFASYCNDEASVTRKIEESHFVRYYLRKEPK